MIGTADALREPCLVGVIDPGEAACDWKPLRENFIEPWSPMLTRRRESDWRSTLRFFNIPCGSR